MTDEKPKFQGVELPWEEGKLVWARGDKVMLPEEHGDGIWEIVEKTSRGMLICEIKEGSFGASVFFIPVENIAKLRAVKEKK